MTESLDAIQRATALLAEAAQVDRSSLSDAALVQLMRLDEAAGRFIDASRVLDAGEVAERSRYELGASGLSMRFGERKPVNFIEQLTRVSAREAARRVRIGAQVRPRTSIVGEVLPAERPIVAEAMVNGLIGIDTAGVIVVAIKQAERGVLASPENLDIAELELVRQGTVDSTDLVADAGRVWRDALDPDGIEPRYDEIQRRRLFTVGREHGGITEYLIHAGPILAAAINAALEDSMDPDAGPRFLSENDLANARIESVESHGRVIDRLIDPRSLGQKRYDIIEGVVLAGLSATRDGEPSFRTIGTITAVVDARDLESRTGFGIIEGIDEVVPIAVIRHIASTALTRHVDRPGRRSRHCAGEAGSRFFTGEQRRCLVSRDGDRCVAKGCRRRASQCHAHHVVFFSRGGSTSVDNGVLLCPAHHRALHQGSFEVRMVDGMPQIRDGVDRCDDAAWWWASRDRLPSPRPRTWR